MKRVMLHGGYWVNEWNFTCGLYENYSEIISWEDLIWSYQQTVREKWHKWI